MMAKVTLSNGVCFDQSSNISILESARSSGVLLEHSCQSGRCGVCKAQVIKGLTETLRDEVCLGPADVSSGYILTCCRAAVTDLDLDVYELSQVPDLKIQTLPCKIDGLSLLCSSVIEVTLRLAPGASLNYLPGQYVNVIGRGGFRRSYSIANAPRTDCKLTLHIRRVPNGVMSRYWFEEARVGDLLRLVGPLGTFWLREASVSQLVLMATGTGIAPIRAMLEQLLTDQSIKKYQTVRVYWGNRTEEDVYWAPDFLELPLEFSNVLSRSVSDGFGTGYVQDAVLGDGVDLSDCFVYAAGSAGMIEGARDRLVRAGLDPRAFLSDAFVISG